MKDSSFDKHFAEGLKNLERKPRPQAWEAIENRLTPPKKKAIAWPWYAVAASVAVVLIGGYGYMQSVENQSIELANDKIKTGSVEVLKPIKQIKEQNKPIISLPVEQQVADRKIVLPTKNYLLNDGLAKEKPKEIVPVPQQNQAILQEVLQPQNSIAKQESTLPQSQQNVNIVEINQANVAKTNIQKQDNVLIVNVKELQEENTLAQNTQTTSLISDMPTKKTFKLGKFLKELNKARRGDAANWEEAGLKPDNILAKADEKIELGKEKVNETYQNVKQKLTLK